MPLGTKWLIELELTEPVGDLFLEGMISDHLNHLSDDGDTILNNVKITCLRELTEKEYQEHDEMMKRLKDGTYFKQE